MTVDMAATFINPLLEVSQRALHFTAVLVSQEEEGTHAQTHAHTHTHTRNSKNVSLNLLCPPVFLPCRSQAVALSHRRRRLL